MNKTKRKQKTQQQQKTASELESFLRLIRIVNLHYKTEKCHDALISDK